MTHQRIVSAIRPTGSLSIGNYVGALGNWVNLLRQYDERFVFVANLHALTTLGQHDPKVLRKNTYDLVRTYMAAGINPKNFTVFVQSQTFAHTQLMWIFANYTKMNELEVMTQYKEKKKSKSLMTNAGLFMYPVLMAADILLYQPDAVPVGADQKQHVEIARNIAKRFNKYFGPTFKLPEFVTPKVGTKIMALGEPTRKMDKSDPNPKNTIFMDDRPAAVIKKIKAAATDSEGKVYFEPVKKPGISNLLTLQSAITHTQMEELEQRYIGKGYADLKRDTAEVINALLFDFQKAYAGISDKEIERVIAKGKAEAELVATKTLDLAKKAIGLL